MHTLFNEPYGFNSGVQNLNGWNNARTNIYTELNKVADYYHEAADWLPNHHPLVKILKDDHSMLYEDANNTFIDARNRWLRDANMYGINTVYRRAASTIGNIAYPRNIKEILVMDDSTMDVNQAKLTWKDLAPIKVLDHPYSDLALCIPNGNYQNPNGISGVAFITINIPLLILQYRLWQKYEAERNGFDKDNPAIFLVRYPLFNIINSHMDVIIRNRFMKFYQKQEPDKFYKAYQGGVVVNDTSNMVDRALRHCADIVRKTPMRFVELHQQIPQLSVDNLQNSLILPDMSFTRTVRWVYDASRVNWYCFLLQYNEELKNSKNIAEIEHMRRRVKLMINDKEFTEAFGINSENHYHRLKSLLNI